MATVGERDRARTGTVSRPRRDLEGEYRAREERKSARKARGERPRIEEATTMEEALEAEREAGRAEGATKSPKPSTTSTKPSTSSARPARAFLSSSPSSAGSAGVTIPMIADVLIISADEIVTQKRLPLPSRLLVAFAVFGVLGAAKGAAARPAKVFAWSIVVATFYSAAPGGKPPALTALDVAGRFLSGEIGTSNTTPATGGPGPASGDKGPAVTTPGTTTPGTTTPGTTVPNYN